MSDRRVVPEWAEILQGLPQDALDRIATRAKELGKDDVQAREMARWMVEKARAALVLSPMEWTRARRNPPRFHRHGIDYE